MAHGRVHIHEATTSDECRGKKQPALSSRVGVAEEEVAESRGSETREALRLERWQATQFSLRALTGKIESQSHGPGNQCHDTVMTYVISGIIVTTSCCAHRVRSLPRAPRRARASVATARLGSARR